MTDTEIIKIGDVCAYFYDNQNKSFSIVEIIEELSDECVVVKFHQVLRDNSGNGLFTYLCDTGKTMNVSRKYLHKLDLINRQKTEIEILIRKKETLRDEIAELQAENERLNKEIDRLSQCVMYHDGQIVDAIKEFAESLKHELEIAFDEPIFDTVVGKIIDSTIDSLIDEMAGDNNV